MASPKPSPALQAHLEAILPQSERSSLRTELLPALLQAISAVSLSLRTSHHVNLAGTANTFGDDQLNVDVAAENIIRDALAACPSVATASSEEDPVESTVHQVDGSGETYTVAFDPLDGSSIIAPNWTVGTIVGIWEGTSALHQSPRERQIVSILGVLGPRTTAFVAVRVPGGEPCCFEVSLDYDSGGISASQIISPEVRLLSELDGESLYPDTDVHRCWLYFLNFWLKRELPFDRRALEGLCDALVWDAILFEAGLMSGRHGHCGLLARVVL